jgi:uncharacterized Zn-finger protein
MSAMELIHQQPVRWTKQKVVSCDGGGGPLGHPRIFINTDKPQICWCTYCGVPYVSRSSSSSAAIATKRHAQKNSLTDNTSRQTSTTASISRANHLQAFPSTLPTTQPRYLPTTSSLAVQRLDLQSHTNRTLASRWNNDRGRDESVICTYAYASTHTS